MNEMRSDQLFKSSLPDLLSQLRPCKVMPSRDFFFLTRQNLVMVCNRTMNVITINTNLISFSCRSAVDSQNQEYMLSCKDIFCYPFFLYSSCLYSIMRNTSYDVFTGTNNSKLKYKTIYVHGYPIYILRRKNFIIRFIVWVYFLF